MKTAETNAAELARLMVGRDVLLRVEKTDAAPGGAVLERARSDRSRASTATRVDDVSFEVRAGEIVGIAGIEGNGQTELIEALAGLARTVTAGEFDSKARTSPTASARELKELGIAHVPEDRHRRGPAARFRPRGKLDPRRPLPPAGRRRPDLWTLRRSASASNGDHREFRRAAAESGSAGRSLSGGNQQKLIIGREFELNPKLLLVSQPTRGVDIGAIEFIHRKLVGLRDAGCAVLLVSAELEEVTALADRLLVMREGKIVGEVDPKTDVDRGDRPDDDRRKLNKVERTAKA